MEMTLVQEIAISAIPLIFAITLHEVAHGWAASWCGDQTARLMGRLSLNPARHIDPVGTIIVPLLMMLSTHFIFGWAKPVPVDARNMRHPRRDMALVAMAGPLANFVMAFFWAAIGWVGLSLSIAGYGAYAEPIYYMGRAGIMINVVLGVLNLVPLPPLDGGRVLASVLPPRMAYKLSMIEPYSFFILIFLLVTGILSVVITGPILLIIGLLRSLFGL